MFVRAHTPFGVIQTRPALVDISDEEFAALPNLPRERIERIDHYLNFAAHSLLCRPHEGRCC